MVYDLQGGNFPNLPKQITRKQAHKSAAPTHNHSNAIETPTGTAATQEVLSQLLQEMKQEFMTMIQNEVKLQIQQEMVAMQTEVANMSTKIDTLQDGIKETIGAAIREAMRASFQEYAQPARQHSPNSQACYPLYKNRAPYRHAHHQLMCKMVHRHHHTKALVP
jgi:ADP-ribosylglycohydrolase